MSDTFDALWVRIADQLGVTPYSDIRPYIKLAVALALEATPPKGQAEAVAWQMRQLTDGIWSNWGEIAEDTSAHFSSLNRTDYQVRPLFASPAPAGRGVEKMPWPQECATEGCEHAAAVYFVRANVGSHYCAECYLKIQALTAAPTEGK